MSQTNPEIVHGCCRGVGGERCTKRTWLYLPGRLCWKCLDKVNARILAELQRMEETMPIHLKDDPASDEIAEQVVTDTVRDLGVEQ